MNVFNSIRGLIRATATDVRFSRSGTRPGWYLRTFYRGRIEDRNCQPPTQARVRIKSNGTPMTLYMTTHHLGALEGVFLDNEYDLSTALDGFKPDRILDLGANVGMAAAYLHAFYPAAEFICVEPDPRNQPLLEQTIEANSIPAKVVPAAVASQAGSLRLRMGDNPTCSALETSPMHVLNSSTEVKVVTVPDLLKRAGWESVDLLKIDIEGTEQELLGRNNDWLNRVKVIVLEIHPNTSPEEIGHFLKPFDFKLKRLGNGREPVYLAVRA